jgi:uncharacterized RDD family membrane protein YckC
VISGVSAGFGRRFAALLYDAVLLGSILIILTTALVFGVLRDAIAITPETVGAWAYVYRAALLAVIIGYNLLNWTRSGQTLGMRAWRLRAVNAQGRPLAWKPALLRLFWSALAWAPAGLGVLWIYWDPEHLALQDRLSNTRVVHLTGS